MHRINVVLALVLISLPLLAACTGCSSKEQTPDQIRQQTAKATATLKRDTVAVAQGVREGLSKDKVVDLNSASKSELGSLPGITDAKADRIIGARPFDNTDQLVTRRILTPAEFDQISGRITVKK